MVRFAEEKDLVRVNELRKQVNDIHANARPDILKPVLEQNCGIMRRNC